MGQECKKCIECTPCSQNGAQFKSSLKNVVDESMMKSVINDNKQITAKMIQTSFNVVPNNILPNGNYEFNLPSFDTTFKFYIFAKKITYNVNKSHMLSMRSVNDNTCRFEIYFKKDNNNKIRIDNDKMKESRTQMVQHHIYKNVQDPNSKTNTSLGFYEHFDSDIITIVVSDSDYASRFAYAEIDHKETDIRFQCP